MDAKRYVTKPNRKGWSKLLVIYGTTAVILVAACIFIASCSRSMDVEESPQEYTEYVEVDANDVLYYIASEEALGDYGYINSVDLEEALQVVETQQERNVRIERERREFARSITREQILEDFDYMMAVLEDNFPFFDLTYRRHGVDIREEASRFRDVLADESMHIDARIFDELLLSDFFNSIYWVGHIRAITRSEYVQMMALNGPETLWGAIFIERSMAHPSTSQFYGAFDESDFASVLEHFESGMHSSDNFNMRIIEDGNVAYIRVNRLFDASDTHRDKLGDFYNQITDFSHLIIDIRGNTGGWPHVFHELITVPHLRRPVQLDIVSFYKDGEYNLRLLDTLFDPRYSDSLERPSHFYGETFTINNEGVMGRDGSPLFLSTQYLVWSDLAAFDYYNVGFYYALYPSGPNGMQSNFNGQKWILMDGFSFSGSEHVLALYKQEDLAIIVGEQGRGVFMCPTLFSNYFALPNTGIIIRYDVGYPICLHTGRPLEDGTLPHFFNFPDMDALQTTLALIAEGAYR